ncbi:MAG: hypothetical protein A2Y97_01475 [Nitrospirae bacterium RBG_13_39_12]|nr:MAG: hypothetical protein A2Y97_01475 [Nitrospirae bacterium RBG_13_39_12]
MRKRNPHTFIFILFLTIILLVLSFKNLLHSETDTTDIPLESNPYGIAINPVNNIAVVANEKSDSISVIDLNNNTVLSTINVGKAPRGVAIDRGLNLAVISNSHDDSVSIIDLNTFHAGLTIAVGKEPQGIAVNPANHVALVTNHQDNTVSMVDLLTMDIIETVQVGREPKDVAVDPELDIAAVVNEKDCTVSVIDLTTHQVTGTVSVGQKPQAIDINPETHLAVIANEKDNSVTVINLQTWQMTRIPAGKHPVDIAINSLDNRALVICDEDRSLFLVDLNTGIIVRQYALNKLPKGVAVNNFTNIAAIVNDKTDCLTLIELPNPIPEILSVTPDNSEKGSSDISISIEGKKFITSSIAYFDNQSLTTSFIDNNHIQATIKNELLSIAGIFPVTVINPQPEGGTSSSHYFTINNPVPSISAIEPAEAMAGDSTTISIYGTGFSDDTEIFLGNTKKLTAYVNNSKLLLNLTSEDLETPGQYEIMAYNSPPGGGNSNKVIFIIRFPLEIEITSPSGGETINKEGVMVKGTIKSDTGDIGITVNGIIAEIMGKEWIANDVPLTVGENTITAIASDTYGNTDTNTITINTNDVTQTVKLSADITSGIPPLTTYFSSSISLTPVSYQMDFEGDGVIDHSGITFEDINYTYTSEGIYYPTLTVTDDQGNTYSDTIAITIMSKTEIDTLLKGKWEGMKEAMVIGDTNYALRYISSSAQEMYSYNFELMKDILPSIVQSMSDINLDELEDGVAKYHMNAIQDGTGYSFYVEFIKDDGGLWKILFF